MNPNKLKVSVITVCRNSADTIEQTIQSVITQEYPNIEYIIVD
ncbi:MAG: glycosyltransferase, partial [Ruminococcus flavefaciens]|nr:glycosyltransferase [Ruminococcus flavefaciens]